jgi:enoyl-CoA hydratase
MRSGAAIRPSASTAATAPPSSRSGTRRSGTTSTRTPFLREHRSFFEDTVRRRDLRKITTAQVQGNAISAGLMLIWAGDLIIAADNAKSSDVVAARFGIPGVEYFAHPSEFGPRKAKELLLTDDALDADEAYRLEDGGQGSFRSASWQ